MVTTIHRQLAEELGVRAQQVEAAVTLLDGGATVPFIARYRKEAKSPFDKIESDINKLREM